jgi:hypothetical protein
MKQKKDKKKIELKITEAMIEKLIPPKGQLFLFIGIKMEWQYVLFE